MDEDYKTFFSIIGKILSYRINARVDLPNDSMNELRSIKDSAINALVENANTFSSATGRLEPTVEALLMKELQYFNDLYQDNSERQRSDKAVEDSETVNDSIEEILDEWLSAQIKQLLTILNDVLKLAY